MDNKENNITDYIDRYLNGELTAAEIVLFDNKMNSDTDFKRQVEAQKAVAKAFKAIGREKMKAMLTDFHHTEIKPMTVISPAKQKTNYFIYYAAAASVLLILALTVFINRDRIFNNEKTIAVTDTLKNTMKDSAAFHNKNLAENKSINDSAGKNILAPEKKLNAYKCIEISIKETGDSGFGFTGDSAVKEKITMTFVISTMNKFHYSFYNDTLSLYSDKQINAKIAVEHNNKDNSYRLVIGNKKFNIEKGFKNIEPIR